MNTLCGAVTQGMGAAGAEATTFGTSDAAAAFWRPFGFANDPNVNDGTNLIVSNQLLDGIATSMTNV